MINVRLKKWEQFKTDGTLLTIICPKKEILLAKVKSICCAGVDLTVFNSPEDADQDKGSFKFMAFDWIKSAKPYAG